MNLTEFLAQPEIAALTLTDQVVAANEYSVTETVKIEGSTRKTAVETVNLMYNTVDRLKAYTPPPELDVQYHDAATDIASKVVKAFENLYNPEFYINLADSEVNALFTLALNLGVLTATEHSRIVQAATKITFPFATVTQSQLNSAKGLFVSKTITHTAGKHIVLTLNADLHEKVAATAWVKEAGFADENAGRNVYIQAAQKYRIDMTSKKSGEYEIRVPLLDADFIVESV